MRDHPKHQRPVMGGLWDVKLSTNRTRYVDLFKEMLMDRNHSLAPQKERDHDQQLLEKYFW